MLYDELDEPIRSSLLRGYVEKSWRLPHLAEVYADLVAEPVHDEEAYADGLYLRSLLDTLFSSDTVSEARTNAQAYDEFAAELNVRYGESLVVLSSEPGPPGLRGFRSSPFSTMTEMRREPDGSERITVTDLDAETTAHNDADRHQHG